MKYENMKTVPAVYTDCPAMGDNPILEALPELLTYSEFVDRLASRPVQADIQKASYQKRVTLLATLPMFFQPMDYMYAIYERLYRAIQATYTGLSMQQMARQICDLHNGKEKPTFITQSDSGSILGVPGIGKTSTLRRCLDAIPQVIQHEQYKGNTFFAKQIVWLFVECPSDCSTKTLAFNVISAIDNVIGSTYFDSVNRNPGASVSSLTTMIEKICLNHHIGLIVLDEIQNIAAMKAQGNRAGPLIRFLVELMNVSGTAVWLIGTPVTENVFVMESHLKRRTRGFRLLPMKPDGVYRKFIEELWQYQYTLEAAQLTDSMANFMYDLSGGIPAYIIQIFQESQFQALASGKAHIDKKLISETCDRLMISPPQQYPKGTSISDFSAAQPIQINDDDDNGLEMQNREHTSRAGRKATRRDDNDLLFILKGDVPMEEALNLRGIMEVIPC